MIPKNLDEIRRDIAEAKRNAREDDARENELVEQLRLSLAKAEADRDRLRALARDLTETHQKVMEGICYCEFCERFREELEGKP